MNSFGIKKVKIMIKLIENGFEIYHNKLLLIKHDMDHPAFFLGDKSLNIDMKNGEFSYDDQTIFNPVTSFIIKDQIIDFTEFQIILDEDDTNSLTLRFQHLDRPIKLILPSDKSEAIYGMGEHFTSLNLKGKVVRNWVEEHITKKQIYSKILRRILRLKPKKWHFEDYKTYYVTPTFISSKHYFCHVDTLGYAMFDFKNEDEHQIKIYSGINKIVFSKRESLLEISSALCKHVGISPKLPDWIFDGMIFAIQGGTDIINKKMDLLLEHNVKINGIWSQDWCGEIYTFFGKQVFWNWKVDEKLYPNLKESIKDWESKKIKFLAYINPYLNANGDMYQLALKSDYLVKNSDGTPFLTKATSFDFGIIDLTNKKAYHWLKELIKINYLNLGIKGWMADFGEYLPVKCKLNDGLPEELHNAWPDLWAKLNREALEESKMLSSAIFFNRAGYKDNNKYSTLVWNGDQHVDFTDDFGMSSALRAMLSLSFSGIGLSHSDIGGYTTVPGVKRSKEVYIRWLEMNTFIPVMRSHEGNMPWKNVQFDHDEETLKLTSKFTNIHFLLKPYFMTVEKEYQDFGYPMIRPIMFHYNYQSDKVFMLGKDLLVYPVLGRKIKKQNIYIPKGTWMHLFTGKTYQEGDIVIPTPLGMPLVFFNTTSIHQDTFKQVIDYIKIFK